MKGSRVLAIIASLCLFASPSFAAINTYLCSTPFIYELTFGENYSAVVGFLKDKKSEAQTFNDHDSTSVFVTYADHTALHDSAVIKTGFRSLAPNHRLIRAFEGSVKIYIRVTDYHIEVDPAYAIESPSGGVVFMANAENTMFWLCKDDEFGDGSYEDFFNILNPMDIKLTLEDLERGKFVNHLQPDPAAQASLRQEQESLFDVMSVIKEARSSQGFAIAASIAMIMKAIVLWYTKNPGVANSYAPLPPNPDTFQSCDTFTSDQLDEASADLAKFAELKKQSEFNRCLDAVKAFNRTQYCSDPNRCA